MSRIGAIGASLFAAMSAGFLGVLSPRADAQTSSVAAECDQLAASRIDTTRPPGVPGVAFNSIDVKRAIASCGDAVKSDPNNARLQYQYGRALAAGKRGTDAISSLRKAVGLGSALAANDLGAFAYHGLVGIQQNQALGLEWFEYAAKKGLTLAMRNAAQKLEEGFGKVPPNLPRAYVYWRDLADRGDAEASEKVGIAIVEKRIPALAPTEVVQRLQFAADQDRFFATRAYVNYLREQGTAPDTLQRGAKYALQAHRLARAASMNTEEGWPVYIAWSFRAYSQFVAQGARNIMPADQYKQGQSDYLGPITKLKAPVDCSGTPATVEIYIWQWTRAYPQSDAQAEWFSQARGCSIAPNLVKSLRQIYDVASSNNVSFPDLALNSLTPPAAPGGDKKSTTAGVQESQTVLRAQENPPGGVTGAQIAGAAAAIAGSFACWYWSDKCQELAWEAAKESVKELVRRK